MRTAASNHAGAHCALGEVLLHVRKDDVRAEEHFREALERDEEYYPMADYHLRCLVKNVREGYADAEERFREAIELDPTYSMAQNKLGPLLANLRKKVAGAEAAYRKAVGRAPPRHHVRTACPAWLKC